MIILRGVSNTVFSPSHLYQVQIDYILETPLSKCNAGQQLNKRQPPK